MTKEHQSMRLLASEETANDSNKDFVPPAGQTWNVHSVSVLFVTTATVGNRVLTVELIDPNGKVCGAWPIVSAQAASLTHQVTFSEAYGTGFSTGTTPNVKQVTGLPKDFIVPPLWTLRVRDSAAIDAAADDMNVYIYGEPITV